MAQAGVMSAPRREAIQPSAVEGAPRPHLVRAIPERLFGRREQLPTILRADGQRLGEVRYQLALASNEGNNEAGVSHQTETITRNQKRNMEHLHMMVERQIQFSKDYPDTHPLHLIFNPTTIKETVEFIGGTLIEAFSGTGSPWGPGDAISLGEAILGRTMFGEKLSKWEKIGEAVAAAIPFVPAYPVIKLYRLFRLPVETAVLPKVITQTAQSRNMDPRQLFMALGTAINEAKHPNDPKYQEALQIAANRLFPPTEEIV